MKYKLSCQNPLSKRLKVCLSLEKQADTLILNLPKWRPGRYEYGNFAGHIYSVKARIQGKDITLAKSSTHQWRLEDDWQGPLEIEYEAYANRLDAGGTYVDEDFWLVNPINCILCPEGAEDETFAVELDIPNDFKTSTSLNKKEEHWIAKSFDQLVDSPILVSRRLNRITFEVDKKPFVLAIHGEHEQDEKQLVEDFRKYTRAQSDVLPWEGQEVYEYQLLFFPFRIYHGVEHMNGTTIVLGPANGKDFYENLLGVSSHELFHYWNIKRIRPKELSPYRFQEKNYIKTGYVAEGFTTYYGDLFLVRGGVFDEQWYLNELNRLLKRHFENYGRHAHSLVSSSQDLWVDGYRNEAPHRKVSIYVKGALVALMLDLNIRKERHRKKFNTARSNYCNLQVCVCLVVKSFFDELISFHSH
ncbi:MAG: M61 family peptidase, partial [Bacteroidota bacterium]